MSEPNSRYFIFIFTFFSCKEGYLKTRRKASSNCELFFYLSLNANCATFPFSHLIASVQVILNVENMFVEVMEICAKFGFMKNILDKCSFCA